MPMRQNMGKTYIENGAFYITTKKLLIKNKTDIVARLECI